MAHSEYSYASLFAARGSAPPRAQPTARAPTARSYLARLFADRIVDIGLRRRPCAPSRDDLVIARPSCRGNARESDRRRRSLTRSAMSNCGKERGREDRRARSPPSGADDASPASGRPTRGEPRNRCRLIPVATTARLSDVPDGGSRPELNPFGRGLSRGLWKIGTVDVASVEALGDARGRAAWSRRSATARDDELRPMRTWSWSPARRRVTKSTARVSPLPTAAPSRSPFPDRLSSGLRSARSRSRHLVVVDVEPRVQQILAPPSAGE